MLDAGVALALKIGGQNGNFFQCTYSKNNGSLWENVTPKTALNVYFVHQN